MNAVLRKPLMTREQFFLWAGAQDARYEFDGFEPVAMVGRTINHNRIGLNIHRALYPRLKGSSCQPLGPGAGVATVGDSVRYPDALITRAKTLGESYLVPGVVVVFEVLGASSGRTDRIVKVREYQAVPSILRYVIVERTSIGLTVLERAGGDDPWTAHTLTSGDVLRIPEVGIDIPVDEFYEGVDLPDGELLPSPGGSGAVQGE